jgi:hypothetical protein
VTVYGMDFGHSISDRSRFFSSSVHPGRSWDPSSLLSTEYRRVLRLGINGRSMKLSTHFKLVPLSLTEGTTEA